jgi:hypothetical protein
MDARACRFSPVSILYFSMMLFSFSLLITSCNTNSISPTITEQATSTQPLQELAATGTPTASLPPPPTSTLTCTNDLRFIDDVTIPDNTSVAPGALLDKQWLVENDGNCNWDDRYRLRLINGEALGAEPEQALFPARAGATATLQILFTAPQTPGTYLSEWQAFDANGIPFGASFFIKVIVQ